MKIAIGIDVHMVKCAAYAVYASMGEPRQLDFPESFNKETRISSIGDKAIEGMQK